MDDSLLEPFRTELARDRAEGLWRSLDCAPPDALALCTNDYLGLSRHPSVVRAAIDATRDLGTGARAARTLHGTTPEHLELEKELAAFKATPAALLFPTGYMAALGVVGTLAGKDDVCILDRACHACLFDGARLAGARLRVFRHNDPGDLESILAHERGLAGEAPRLLIITESLFSMDGDLAPLRDIAALARRFRALLLVDEAHANGLYGPGGAGRIAELDCGADVAVHLGTLGKSLASSGGFIAAATEIIDFLRQRARSFLFTTAAPPATAAAARAALRIVTSPEGDRLRRRLRDSMARARDIFPDSVTVESPILTLPVPGEDRARALQEQLARQGILVAAARHPTVPRGEARLRISLTAAYDPDTVAAALTTIEKTWRPHHEPPPDRSHP